MADIEGLKDAFQTLHGRAPAPTELVRLTAFSDLAARSHIDPYVLAQIDASAEREAFLARFPDPKTANQYLRVVAALEAGVTTFNRVAASVTRYAIAGGVAVAVLVLAIGGIVGWQAWAHGFTAGSAVADKNYACLVLERLKTHALHDRAAAGAVRFLRTAAADRGC